MTAPNNPEYNPAIPTTETTVADAQSLFLGNFQTLFEAFGLNHVPLDDATNPGNHSTIELLQRPAPQSTDSNEISIYSKLVGDQTEQLFMRYSANGDEFQLSEYQIYPLPSTAAQIGFFSFLPGGIIVYFGRINPTSNAFPLSLEPAICSNIMGVNLCPIGAANAQNYQSNVRLQAVNGKATNLLLDSTPNLPLNQYYLIFGNISL